MNTLRAFVASVLDHASRINTNKDAKGAKTNKDAKEAKANKDVNGAKANNDAEPSYYSKPDTFSDSFELRRLRTTYSRVQTDFFEFYWAHRMPVAPWSRILEWLWLLVSRPRASMPTTFSRLWVVSRIILTLVALGLLASILFFFFPSLRPPSLSGTALEWPLGLTLPLLLLQSVILSYIGDAAIYLSSSPRNIETRQAIRSAGVSLLDRLHASGDYDRIIIVGHSLGSIIGYDILNYAWQRYHSEHDPLDVPNNEALRTAERLARELVQVGSSNQELWRQTSLRLWREQRNAGCPWLVTDFVTLGSPLVHADLLLANSPADFRSRQKQRELPTCPPVLERDRMFSYAVDYKSILGNKRTTSVLHHAACFAVTRWTNLYFPSQWLFFGDFIGGPLAPLFGPGIRDVAVTTSIRNGWLSHTSYWQSDEADVNNPSAAVAQLHDAIDLQRKEFHDVLGQNF